LVDSWYHNFYSCHFYVAKLNACLNVEAHLNFADKKADYDVKVHGLEISPNPVARGQAATFSISASTGKSYY